MKKFRVIGILILLLFLTPSLVLNAMAEENDTSTSDIGSKIEQYVAEHEDTTAGMSVAVFDANQTIYRNCFGYMDVQNKTPVTEETVMEWGSVSKLLVWVSVMQLAEQDKIDLNADINTYLPEDFLQNLSYDTSITMLNLMNHNAGFEESVIGMTTGTEEKIISIEEYLTEIQPKQVYEPGTVCAYSNWGTTLAAYIVERVSGIPYYEYVRKNIFEPLGMKNTSICADLSDNEDVKEKRMELKIYTTDVEEITTNKYYLIAYPTGMCISTIEDMQKFAQALLSENTVLFNKKETYSELFTPSLYFGDTEIPQNYHGFWVHESYGTRVIGHSGNSAGCSSALLLDLENQVGMVIQTNQYEEDIYNEKMPELLFGKYDGTASDYSGLIMSARTIFEGPLKIYKFFSVVSIEPVDPAESYSIKTNENGVDKISYPYGDYLVLEFKDIAMDWIVLGLYVLSLVYCTLNLLIRLIKGLFDIIKRKKEKKVLNVWCTTAILLPYFPVVVLSLIVPTFFNYQQWSILSYRIAFLLVLLSAFAMCALAIYGFIKQKNSITKKSQKIYIHSINICMIVTIINIFYWNWGMFWMI